MVWYSLLFQTTLAVAPRQPTKQVNKSVTEMMDAAIQTKVSAKDKSKGKVRKIRKTTTKLLKIIVNFETFKLC